MAGKPDARRDAQLLLLHVLNADRAAIFAHPERLLTAQELEAYRELLTRRERSEPLQYITGEREFYGLRFQVTPDVLIPRPETEHLVEAALERISINAPLRIIDVGTGSGAIAIALAVERPLAQITAVDISAAALHVAEENATALGVAGRIRFLTSNLLEAVSGESFDMVVSNPPYIADAERESLDAQVKNYEPHGALFAGPTGLEIYQRLIPQAARALEARGWLIMEIGAGQQEHLRPLLQCWHETAFVPDLQGIARVCLSRTSPPTLAGPS